VDFIRYIMVIAAFSVVAGCGDKAPPPASDSTAEKTENKPVVTNNAAVDKKNGESKKYPEVKLPSYLEKTKNMPAGREKAKAVEREYVAEKLVELQQKLMDSSAAMNAAEKKARVADPKLGKLYKDLIDGQIRYRQALDTSEIYAAAKKDNVKALKEYHKMIERSNRLNKKEKSDDK